MANPKALTISQVEQAQSSSVWALNSSGSRGESKGIINIGITEGNGRSAVVRIPVTFIPVDLTTQATKNALTMSPDFRRIVASGLVKLISEEDAMALLDNEESRREQRRLLNIDSQHEVQAEQYSPAVKAILAQKDGNISGLAMNIAHTTEGDEDTVVSNLRNNMESLNEGDLKYIVDNSIFAKVKTMAAERIVRT